MSEQVSTFFFPLRTNVCYFETPGGFLSLVGRIKQALILYDQVLFESGYYQATLGPDGAFDMYLPRTQLPSPDQLKRFDRLMADGRPSSSDAFSLWVQPHGPNTQPELLLTSSIEQYYRSEFHSLLDEFNTESRVDGLELFDVSLTREGKQRAAQLAEEYLRLEDIVLPEGSAQFQQKIVKNFFLDLVLVSSLGCASSIDPLHMPIFGRLVRGARRPRPASGFVALEFEVPHVAALSWERIAEVRALPAIVEYRQRLFGVESTVRNMLPEASEAEIRSEVGNILHCDLVREVKERMAPTGSELVGRVTLQVFAGLVSFVPGIGNLLDIGETAFSIGKEIANSYRESRTWQAVLMKLSCVD